MLHAHNTTHIIIHVHVIPVSRGWGTVHCWSSHSTHQVGQPFGRACSRGFERAKVSSGGSAEPSGGERVGGREGGRDVMEELLVVRVTNLLASDRVQVVLLWGTNDAQNNVHLVQVCWWSVVKEHTHTHTLVHSTHTKNIIDTSGHNYTYSYSSIRNSTRVNTQHECYLLYTGYSACQEILACWREARQRYIPQTRCQLHKTQ